MNTMSLGTFMRKKRAIATHRRPMVIPGAIVNGMPTAKGKNVEKREHLFCGLCSEPSWSALIENGEEQTHNCVTA